MSRHWTLEDIRWEDFDASKVDPDILRAVKAAAMVEFNAPDYVTYLCNVFSDRPDVKEAIHKWGTEEVQHGQALARWAELADPGFSVSFSEPIHLATLEAHFRLHTMDADSRPELVADEWECRVRRATSSARPKICARARSIVPWYPVAKAPSCRKTTAPFWQRGRTGHFPRGWISTSNAPKDRSPGQSGSITIRWCVTAILPATNPRSPALV